MKLLMIYCTKFGYQPATKTIEELPDINEGREFENTLVGFIQAEANDEEDPTGVLKKLLKNIKWAAGKNNTRLIVLHSFAHLADSKASVEFSKELFDNAEERLRNTEYEVYQTAFGYFMDLSIEAPGYSLARLYKAF